MSQPFEYPAEPIQRRHAPRGYERPVGYRPWLRDDFSFRCVFCLLREAWVAADLQVEHFEPVALAPDRQLDYANLLYACHLCNGKKGKHRVPDPCGALIRGDIHLGDEGRLVGRTDLARTLIATLALNSKRQCKFREMWSSIVTLAQRFNPDLYQTLMGFPALLPDLERLRPPGGNDKPDGVAESCRSRRLRGELPETY